MLIVVLCILIAVVLVFFLIGINTRSLSAKSSKERAAAQLQTADEPVQESTSAVRMDVLDASHEMKKTANVKPQQSRQGKADKMADQDYRKALLQQSRTEEQSKTEEKNASAMNDSDYRNALRSMHDAHSSDKD
ncbi:hypothetical protein [Ectobacillus panaciterrae]|uniref:hypothetical protein n=1 Tax=Ectobacillus panaciterrae TaxID=363872 RepID=UPI00041AEF94|nr:hypothetical protein [Ectobacillus panaciterrae]